MSPYGLWVPPPELARTAVTRAEVMGTDTNRAVLDRAAAVADGAVMEQPPDDAPAAGLAAASDHGLPVAMDVVLTQFTRHLRLERGLSPHTVRAYRPTSRVCFCTPHAVGPPR